MAGAIYYKYQFCLENGMSSLSISKMSSKLGLCKEIPSQQITSDNLLHKPGGEDAKLVHCHSRIVIVHFTCKTSTQQTT
jgi:hypothetical protein